MSLYEFVVNQRGVDGQLVKDYIREQYYNHKHTFELSRNLGSVPSRKLAQAGCYVWGAIYNNDIKSTAVDNWKDFELLPASFPMWHRSIAPKENPYETFVKNLKKCGTNTVEIINQNYLNITKDSVKTKSNIIFYDGEHTFKDQYAIMSKLKDLSSDVFILVVDDWNWEKRGILKGISDFHYKCLYQKEILTKGEDPKNFWNGLGIFILSNA